MSACREPYRYDASELKVSGEEFGHHHGGDHEHQDHQDQNAGESTGRDTEETLSETWRPLAPLMRRLTRAQYQAKLNAAFNTSITITNQLPEELIVDGSRALGTAKSTLSIRDAEMYAALAYEIAAQLSQRVELLTELAPCLNERVEGEISGSCLNLLLNTLGERLWGRALKEIEHERALSLFMASQNAGLDLEGSLEFVLAWLLQSPHFLFRVEERDPELEALTPHTLAERLSYFLTNAPPTPSLRQRGESLWRREVWESAVDDLLNAPELEQSIRALFDDLWSLERLDRLHLNKDPERFEHLSAQLGAAAREETLMGVWRLTRDDLPFADLFTERRAYLNQELAALYGVAAPSRSGFAWTMWPESDQRVGLFGQVSFLALNAHPTATSSTLRGYFVLDKLLCAPPPPPPAGVDTAIPEPTPERPTLRDRLDSHLEAPQCAGCHREMDSIGLTFERFDALGRVRRFERGVEIDPRGELFGVEISGPVELATGIARHPQLRLCLTRRVLRYARALHEIELEEPTIEQIARTLESEAHATGSFTLKQLLRSVALSEAFHGPYIEPPERERGE